MTTSEIMAQRTCRRHSTLSCSPALRLGWWLVCVCLSALALHARAQDAITEDLPSLLKAAMQGNPTLKSAWYELQASGVDVEVAERARWPVVSAIMESRTGNQSSTPSRVVRLEQTLWDGGVAREKIREMEAQKQVAFYRYGQQQQQVFLAVVSAWQSMVAAAEKIEVADRALKRLGQFRAQMERRVSAEASPRIDLQQVVARYDQTAVERTANMTAYKNALSRLQQLTGLPRGEDGASPRLPLVNLIRGTTWGQELEDQEFTELVNQHPAVMRAKAEEEVAKARYEGKAAERWPQIYLRMDQPVGNQASGVGTSSSEFVGIRYTPGAGFSTHLQASAYATRAKSAQENTETAVREVLEFFENDRDEILSAHHKASTLERAVLGSENVLASYLRQFQAGRKTWLDLLNAARELAQNEYALTDARSSLVAAYWKYRVRAQLPLEGTE